MLASQADDRIQDLLVRGAGAIHRLMWNQRYQTNRLLPGTPEYACVPLKKIGLHDFIIGLVNSTYHAYLLNQ